VASEGAEGLSDVTENELALFQVFAQAARKGERAPTTQELMMSGIISPSQTAVTLASKGVIVIYIHGRNWRVIKIMYGPEEGHETEARFGQGPPYLVFDKTGRHEFEV